MRKLVGPYVSRFGYYLLLSTLIYAALGISLNDFGIFNACVALFAALPVALLVFRRREKDQSSRFLR